MVSGTIYGNTAIYLCERGYRLEGNSRIQCTETGWSGPVPSCEIVGRCIQTCFHLSSYHGVQRRMISVVNFSCIFEIITFYFVVAICDLVHDVETIFHLSYMLTASGDMSDAREIHGHHSYFRKDFKMLLTFKEGHT